MTTTRAELLAVAVAERFPAPAEVLAELIPSRPGVRPASWTPAEQAEHRRVAIRESIAYGTDHDMRKLPAVS